MADIVDASSDSHDFLESIASTPLTEVMPSLLECIPPHILALAGVDTDNQSESNSGKSIPFAEYHAKLFRIGTGWLGWSPETTWNATAAEILEAYSGHIEMLRAIHGGSEETEGSNRQTDKPKNAVFDRKGLRELASCQ